MTKYSHEENAVGAAVSFKVQMQQVTEKVTKEWFQDIYGAEVIYGEESNEEKEEIQIEDLEQAPPKIKDNKPQVNDPIEGVNLGTVEEPMITYISFLLSTNLKEHIISLLQNLKIASLGIMMKCQDLIGALWDIAFPSDLNSIISNNHLEECSKN